MVDQQWTKDTSDFAMIAESIQIDEQSMLIRHVALCGPNSKNGYKYRAEAFGTEEECKKLYEGKPVFLDHNRSDAANRSTRDLAAIVRNVTLEDGRPYGDLHVMDNDAGRTLMSIAKVRPDNVGMSHVAKTVFDRKANSIKKIVEVISVDVVVNPATVKNFSEQEGSKNMDAVELLQEQKTELESKVAQLTAATEELKKSVDSGKQTIVALESKVKALESEVDQYKVKEAIQARRVAVDQEIKAAGFDVSDKTIVSEAFVGLLLSCEDANVRKTHIDDRKAIVESAKKAPAPQERQSGSGSTKEFNYESHAAKHGISSSK